MVRGLGFTPPEIGSAVADGTLLRLTVEIEPSRCNLRCRYCWTNDGTSGLAAPSLERLAGVIDQGIAAGVRTIVLTGGGEPLLDRRRLEKILSHCESAALWVVVFTNGLCVSDSLARDYRAFPLSLVAKLHTLADVDAADWMAGQAGAHDKMLRAVRCLLAAGWASDGRLGVETVILRRNCREIPAMWRWMRRTGVVPYFEVPKRLGRAQAMHDHEFLTVTEMGSVFRELCAIDKGEFGYDWFPVPPVAGLGCDKWQYSLFVSSGLDVFPCAGVPISLGNLERSALSDILASPQCAAIRDVNSRLKGRCHECSMNPPCYGCRASVYASGAHFFSQDPFCWVGSPE